MARPDVRTLLRWGVASAVLAGAAHIAHATSLNGIDSDSVAAWTYPAAIDTVDAIPPTIDAVVDPAPNGFGWNNSAVTVSFVCSDGESGIASCTDPVTLTTEGADQVVIGNATDNAGNNASTSASVDIDLTAPTVVINGLLPGSILPTLPPATCSATDALSGVDGPCIVTYEPAGGVFFDAVGTARDRAGNVAVERVRFSLSTICLPLALLNTLPCIVPPGFTISGNLNWRADVQVYGTITGSLRVDDGEIAVHAGGAVGGSLDQRGSGSVTLSGDATVGGAISEIGPGDVTIGESVVVSTGRIDESDDGSIFVDGTVDVDVFENDAGDVVVRPTGTVTVSIAESGVGSVLIDGFVGGAVDESGDGDISIGSSATVNSLHERGNGSVVISGVVRGDVLEENTGDLTVAAGAIVDGRLDEERNGSITVRGTVNGLIAESGGGDVTIAAPAVVAAEVSEADGGSLFVATSIGAGAVEDGVGDLVVSPSVTVGGNVVEQRNGNVSVGDAAHITGDADSGGAGICTIASTATVDGNRLGVCAP